MRAFLIVLCLATTTTGCVTTPENSEPKTAEVEQHAEPPVTCWTKVLKLGKAGGIAAAPIWLAIDVGLAVVNYKTAQLCRQAMGVCHGLCKVLGELAEAGGQATYELIKVEKKCDGAALSCKCKFKRTPIPQDDKDNAPVAEEELAPTEAAVETAEFDDSSFPFSLPISDPSSTCTPSYSDPYPCADNPEDVCVDETSCCPAPTPSAL